MNDIARPVLKQILMLVDNTRIARVCRLWHAILRETIEYLPRLVNRSIKYRPVTISFLKEEMSVYDAKWNNIEFILQTGQYNTERRLLIEYKTCYIWLQQICTEHAESCDCREHKLTNVIVADYGRVNNIQMRSCNWIESVQSDILKNTKIMCRLMSRAFNWHISVPEPKQVVIPPMNVYLPRNLQINILMRCWPSRDVLYVCTEWTKLLRDIGYCEPMIDGYSPGELYTALVGRLANTPNAPSTANAPNVTNAMNIPNTAQQTHKLEILKPINMNTGGVFRVNTLGHHATISTIYVKYSGEFNIFDDMMTIVFRRVCTRACATRTCSQCTCNVFGVCRVVLDEPHDMPEHFRGLYGVAEKMVDCDFITRGWQRTPHKN